MSDEEGTSSSTTTNASELKLPHFWPNNPRVWFSQVEARFQLRHITSQESKYLHVVAALPPDIADAVDDVLASTPSDKAYDELKSTVLKRLEVSEQSKLQQLLSHEELGDQRPSQLLHQMRQLLRHQASEERQQPLLRELFLQRLPQYVTRRGAAPHVSAPANVTQSVAAVVPPAPPAGAACAASPPDKQGRQTPVSAEPRTTASAARSESSVTVPAEQAPSATSQEAMDTSPTPPAPETPKERRSSLERTKKERLRITGPPKDPVI
ncbi:sterile alpha motif domain-containing protein 1-like [Rhipicephalus sanguineus]|uniref:sterile alpha motif domain-containing protein 1-like n=1 Tax=Rhipicephalus sanguineus TaxID=34632 RepID=UPI00189436B9|nr:sterile alpha motif domain-containing protein 1-like [Rhipicephalus sanguineus]